MLWLINFSFKQLIILIYKISLLKSDQFIIFFCLDICELYNRSYTLLLIGSKTI